ncbi:unnamed protein product [Toxocara canis]|uniref:Y+L amino acid transporter 2 n=1 Tax=Toxocara canis TaxID=6265 RepID=A0A183UTM1_TOXCA|nr:unnamed protein product [Toxocara canis]
MLVEEMAYVMAWWALLKQMMIGFTLRTAASRCNSDKFANQYGLVSLCRTRHVSSLNSQQHTSAITDNAPIDEQNKRTEMSIAANRGIMDSNGNDAVKASSMEANKIGFLGCTSYVIGNIIGSGIFITPTSIVQEVNSVGLSLVVWVACGLISLLGSIVYVELGTSIVEPGCDFAYVCFVKWYAVAFAFMWVGVIITFPASTAVQARTFGQYIVEGLSPVIKLEQPYADISAIALGLILLALIVWLNFYSLNDFAAKFQVVVTVAKLGSMALIIGAGFFYLLQAGWSSNLEHAFENSNYGIGNIVLALYGGLTMPFSLIAGIMIVSFIYTLINLSYFVVLSVDEVRNATAIAATFSQTVFGNFSYAVPFMVAILICGTLNSNIFCASRFMYAAAREGHLPTFLSCVNDANGSPRASLFAQAIITAIMVFIDVHKLIDYVSFVMSFQRIATMIALLWIRHKKIPVHPGAIKVPIIFTWLFLAISVALVVIPIVTSFMTTLVGIMFAATGILFYVAVIKRKSTPAWLQSLNGKSTSCVREHSRDLICRQNEKKKEKRVVRFCFWFSNSFIGLVLGTLQVRCSFYRNIAK